MSFIGDVEYDEGRSFSATTTLVLRRCLGGEKSTGRKEVDEFLEGQQIKPSAFFRDIEADWIGRPFIGQHVFKVVQAAGYAGTEDDFWSSVAGMTAPYAVKGRGTPRKDPAVARLKTLIKSDRARSRSASGRKTK